MAPKTSILMEEEKYFCINERKDIYPKIKRYRIPSLSAETIFNAEKCLFNRKERSLRRILLIIRRNMEAFEENKNIFNLSCC